MSDPISLLVSLLNKLFTQFFRKNFVFIAILIVLLVVAVVAISKAITEIAPKVQKTISATSELVEKVSAVQEGFNSALSNLHVVFVFLIPCVTFGNSHVAYLYPPCIPTGQSGSPAPIPA